MPAAPASAPEPASAPDASNEEPDPFTLRAGDVVVRVLATGLGNLGLTVAVTWATVRGGAASFFFAPHVERPGEPSDPAGGPFLVLRAEDFRCCHAASDEEHLAMLRRWADPEIMDTINDDGSPRSYGAQRADPRHQHAVRALALFHTKDQP